MSAGQWMPRWLVPSVAAAVLAPLVVAVAAQRNAHWHPVFDLAMTELRVRDVGGPHTPLIGLQGRIGPSGSHPGPISFYLLAPVYRLLGSSSFALQASTAAFHGAAVLTALLVVARRRDGRVVVGVGLLLLLLMQGYGLGPLTEPWNPHLPVLWFVAFLVAAWAVVEGDLPMLLPAVLAASICAQTHVPYLAVTIGIGAALAVLAVGRIWSARGAPTDWRWVAAAVGLGLLLWLPPLIDQAINDPGNISKLVDHLGSPTDDPIGVGPARRLVVERLDAWLLVVDETADPGSLIRILSGPGPEHDRGVLTMVAWLGCVVASLALRHRRLLALHAVVAVAGIVGVAAISRIYGVPWPYLMFWGFGIGALMALSIAATLLAVGARWIPAMRGPAAAKGVAVAGLVALVALSLRLVVVAPDTVTDTPDQTGQLARIVPDTVTALERGTGAATGDDGRYLVSWSDTTNGGSEGIGMVNELIRQGYDVGVEAEEGVRIGPHRVRSAAESTARIVVASGGWIDGWEQEPGAVQVAFDDPRTAAERAEFEEARSGAIEQLEEIGREDLVEQVDTDIFDLALNGDLPAEVTAQLGRMIDIGVPAAVFILPQEGEA